MKEIIGTIYSKSKKMNVNFNSSQCFHFDEYLVN